MTYGIAITAILIINKLGATLINLDLIFCDFIKHPIASIISAKISNIVRTTTITIKLVNRMVDNIF